MSARHRRLRRCQKRQQEMAVRQQDMLSIRRRYLARRRDRPDMAPQFYNAKRTVMGDAPQWQKNVTDHTL